MADIIRDDRARDAEVQVANPGLSAELPQVQFVDSRSGGMQAPDFARRDPIAYGHQRRSPGDGVPRRVAEPIQPAFYSDGDKAASPDNEAQMGSSQLGPGILPTPAMNAQAEPVRATDFARGFGVPHDDGASRPSPGNASVRGPVSPEQALGLGQERLRNDYFQANQRPSALRGKDFPETAGREGNANGDHAVHQVIRPSVDASPSRGGDIASTIAKHEVIRVEKDLT